MPTISPSRVSLVCAVSPSRTAIGPFAVEDAGEEVDLMRIAELVPAAAQALR